MTVIQRSGGEGAAGAEGARRWRDRTTERMVGERRRRLRSALPLMPPVPPTEGRSQQADVARVVFWTEKRRSRVG